MTVLRHPNNNGVTLSQWRKTAAGGETTLSGTDDFSAGLAYTAGAEQVFVNGVLLERGVDYTASTGTTVTGLTALVAGDIVTVSSPSSFTVANAIPKSTVTAKGDLIAATGASTVTNLPVGSDGTTLVANSSSATGLAWGGQPYANPVLNSAMQLAQRGTTFTGLVSSNYTLDRWQGFRTAGAAYNVSQQSTSDTTNLPFIQSCIRIGRASGNTATNPTYISQTLETVNSRPFSGKTVTLSFYVRAGANFSATSNAMFCEIVTGTGTDQNVLTGFTGGVATISQSNTLTTTWQRFSATGTIPTTSTQMGVDFYYTPTGTAGAADFFEVTGVQIDLGSVALPFRTYAGTLQGELAAAQRYYWRSTTSILGSHGIGATQSTTDAIVGINVPVTMRVVPTSIDFVNLRLVNYGVAAYSISTITLGTTESTQNFLNLTCAGASGMTANRPVFLYGNGSSGYIGASAEL